MATVNSGLGKSSKPGCLRMALFSVSFAIRMLVFPIALTVAPVPEIIAFDVYEHTVLHVGWAGWGRKCFLLLCG